LSGTNIILSNFLPSYSANRFLSGLLIFSGLS